MALSNFRSLALLASLAVGAAAATNPPVDFQRQVRPILSDNCFLCHGPDKGTRMVGLRLDIQEGATEKRKNGVPIVAGKPDESLLIKRISSPDPNFRMPPVFSHKTLTQDQKDILRRWIEQGATWKQHWAFIPPVKAPVPAVKDAAWAHNEIDRFVLAKLESSGLQPAPEADKRTLIRRVTLDLTGLPPTPEDVQSFIKDKAPNAYEKVVDRLLGSQHYGEHRARYWLDAARYADTQGYHFDNYREMWPYRDWVIRAFNKNMPFDRFTVDQLGGDLLPNATLDQKIASGFQRNTMTTNEGGSIPAEVDAMYAKDRADTMGTVWMGLTVGCATCHDHKFDPISQKDYYSLTSFFRNTTQPTMDMNIQDTPPVVYVPPAADRAKWDELMARRNQLRQDLANKRAKSLEQIQAWLKTTASAEIEPYEASSRVLQVKADGSSALPNGVKAAEAIETDGKALQFGKEAKITLPNVQEVDAAKPFTVASWIYLPKTKDAVAVASEYDTVETAKPIEAKATDTKPADTKPADTKRRGWKLTIDAGNLGIYGAAPAFYLMGEDGKSISVRAIPDFTFKQDAWYHVVFTYDGSHRRQGFSMYVNGAAVPAIGKVDDVEVLTSSTKSVAPLMLGNYDKQYFEGGAISDFKILNRMVDAEEAALLSQANFVAAALTKTPESLSQREIDAAAMFREFVSDPAARESVAQLHDVEKAWYDIRARSATTFVMQERADAQPVAHVLYRGQYDQMRDEVAPRVPSVLPPMTQSMPRNRLGLAMWIVDPSNPLTARVTVNRFWQELFGTGLSKTVEDFGSQGEPPSHAELLDWLAVDFRDSGWDVKRLFRMIVLSATYRQSGETTPEKVAHDPDNRLFAHGPRFRMDAEMVRDTALFASGLLRPEVGGASAKPYQPDHIWDVVAMDSSNTRIYKQDDGDNLYRRSVYTFWKRAAPPPSMDIFNAPSRETCTVRRERTNTPLQALVTMNDKQFMEAARVLAQNALESSKQFNGEANYMASRLLSRPLAPQELDVLNKSYQDFLAYYSSSPGDAGKLLSIGEAKADPKLAKPKFAALTMVANEMMNLDEVLVK